MTRTELSNKVSKIFKSANINTDWYVVSDTDIEVYIEDGDWKHDHVYLRLTLEKNGFICIDREQVGEDEGGDWYSANYTFRYMA